MPAQWPLESPEPASIARKFHPDLLWRIFLLNAEMDDHLQPWRRTSRTGDITARYCSQVCHDWRELMLSTPALWGRLIRIRKGGRIWREEVLRRSEQSPLCIEGVLKDNDPDESRFLGVLFGQHLSRIRVINVVVDSTNVPAALWGLLSRGPAPLLERFIIDRHLGPKDRNRRVWLADPFQHNAPRLTYFHIAPFLTTEIDTSTFYGVRSLCVSLENRLPGDVTVRALLTTLRHMTLLENMNLAVPCINYDADDVHDLPIVHLPYLACVTLLADIASFSLILDHITPSSYRFLSFSNEREPSSPFLNGLPPEFSRFQRVVSQLCKAHFSLFNPEHLVLGFSIDRFFVEHHPQGSSVEQAQFSLNITSSDKGVCSLAPCILSSISAACDCDTLRTLELDVDESVCDIVGLIGQPIKEFFGRLDFLQGLITTVAGCHILLPDNSLYKTKSGAKAGGDAVPPRTSRLVRLDVRIMGDPWLPESVPPSAYQPLFDFLDWRRREGTPIKLLNLRYVFHGSDDSDDDEVDNAGFRVDRLNDLFPEMKVLYYYSEAS